jgi:hypothetical protein
MFSKSFWVANTFLIYRVEYGTIVKLRFVLILLIIIIIIIIIIITVIIESRDSSVGTALGYELDDRGSRARFPAGAGNFSLHYRVQNGSGAIQPPMQWVLGAISLGVKRLGREADHSPPSSAEVKECVELYLHSPNTTSWRDA